MAGHSKWAQIKRQKGINDQKRGAVFAKLSKAITLAVVEGGGIADPDLNVKLRVAMEKAKYAEMPKETIQRAVEKGMGPGASALREILYEAFGQGGSAFLIKTATDNPNRTVADLRTVLDRNGGKIGAPGSVTYLFERCGAVTFSTTDQMEEILAFAESCGASDIAEEGDTVTVYVPFGELGKIKDRPGSVHPERPPDEEYRPLAIVIAANEAEEDAIAGLVAAIEELDDVQQVYTNVGVKMDGE
jgi:YebC/PmpR family DNA-binding regulatory protein